MKTLLMLCTEGLFLGLFMSGQSFAAKAAAEVEMSLKNPPKNMRTRHITLEPLASSSDENAHLRPERMAGLK